jgi:hypothetical protein
MNIFVGWVSRKFRRRHDLAARRSHDPTARRSHDPAARRSQEYVARGSHDPVARRGQDHALVRVVVRSGRTGRVQRFARAWCPGRSSCDRSERLADDPTAAPTAGFIGACPRMCQGPGLSRVFSPSIMALCVPATHPQPVGPPRRLHNRRCLGGRDTQGHDDREQIHLPRPLVQTRRNGRRHLHGPWTSRLWTSPVRGSVRFVDQSGSWISPAEPV